MTALFSFPFLSSASLTHMWKNIHRAVQSSVILFNINYLYFKLTVFCLISPQLQDTQVATRLQQLNDRCLSTVHVLAASDKKGRCPTFPPKPAHSHSELFSMIGIITRMDLSRPRKTSGKFHKLIVCGKKYSLWDLAIGLFVHISMSTYLSCSLKITISLPQVLTGCRKPFSAPSRS